MVHTKVFFLSESMSGAVIPWNVYLNICTWGALYWSNLGKFFKMYIFNDVNLWKSFEEHFLEHLRCRIFQFKIMKNYSLLLLRLEISGFPGKHTSSIRLFLYLIRTFESWGAIYVHKIPFPAAKLEHFIQANSHFNYKRSSSL